jgi:hypothetical protein
MCLSATSKAFKLSHVPVLSTQLLFFGTYVQAYVDSDPFYQRPRQILKQIRRPQHRLERILARTRVGITPSPRVAPLTTNINEHSEVCLMSYFPEPKTHHNSWSSVRLLENSWAQGTIQGMTSSISMATAVSTDSVAQGTRKRQRPAHSQTMSCWKYLISVGRETISPFIASGNGTYWRRYAEDGDKSYLRRHAVSISNFFARRELLSGRIWVSGQSFLSLCNTCPT